MVSSFDAANPADMTVIPALEWVQHGKRTVYDNRWVRVDLVDVTPPDGHRFEHHAIRLQTVVMTVVIDDAGRVLMLWRHRFITNSWGWEIPGGIVDAGELPEDTAVRETLEETGWQPLGVQKIAEFQPMPGLVDTPHLVYLARKSVRLSEPTDTEESAVIEWVPLSEIPALITQGKISGAGSLVGLLQLLAGIGQPDTVNSAS